MRTYGETDLHGSDMRTYGETDLNHQELHAGCFKLYSIEHNSKLEYFEHIKIVFN